MDKEINFTTQKQLPKTMRGNYRRWQYEIDTEYESEFHAYLVAHANKGFITLESIKNDLPHCFNHLHSFTAKGNFQGWKYEIDVDNEREFLSYLTTHWSDTSVGSGSAKNGALDVFKHLHSLDLPKTVESIEPYAFADCTKLKSIRSEGCELISKHAFRNCEQLIFGFFPKTKVIKAFSFFRAGINAPVFTLYTPAVNAIESNSFIKCGAQVLFFPSLSNMAYKTIVECPNLEQVSIESALTIENEAIVGNKKLESIYSPHLKHVNYNQVDTWRNLNHFIISQEAKQSLVRKASENEQVPQCFVSISEYQKGNDKSTTTRR